MQSILFVIPEGKVKLSDNVCRLILLLFKLEFIIFKWVQTKKQGEYKKRQVLTYILTSLMPAKEIPLWFFDELFQFLIWNCGHLGCLYPYNRSTVSTAMGEGPKAQDVLKYTSQNKTSLSFNPELMDAFLVIAFTQETDSSRFYIMKKFLDALPSEEAHDILMTRDFFWKLTRLKSKTPNQTTLEKYVGPRFFEFLVKLLVTDLHKERQQSQCLRVLLTDLDSERDAVILFRGILDSLMAHPEMEPGKKVSNFLRNFAQLAINRHAVLPYDVEIDSGILDTIIRLTFKNGIEVRKEMGEAKIFEIRDLMLINMIRLNEDDSGLMKLLTQFSFESICNTKPFRENLALANLVRVLVRSNNEDLQVASSNFRCSSSNCSNSSW